MAATMQVEIVSPERVLFSGEATQVVTRTMGGGEIAFLAGHAPFLGALVESHTRIYLTEGGVLDVAVHGGFVQVGNNKVSILSDQAELAEQIDRQRAVSARERAEEAIRRDASDPEATAALARANARLNATGGQRTGTH
jgi:F-type H+-transporting ATPase subunit epsilon